jgi:hypothetical protein
MNPEKLVNEMHIRHLPGTVYLPPVNCPQLDYPVRVAERKRQRWAVEINNHTGNGCIDICYNPVLESKHNTGEGVTIITKLVILKQQTRADAFRDLCSPVRNRYQEWVAFFH